jgi:cold shock CspA family protein
MAISKPELIGTVKWFNGERGFIVADDGYREIFAHISQVADECDEPRKGDRVNFVEDMGRDGRPYARRIVVVKQT